MKRLNISLLLFVLMSTSNIMAYDIIVDNIYYDVDSSNKTASVTSSNSNRYTGHVSIPKSIEWSGVKYDVTSIGVGAFDVCSSLTSVAIPNSVTSIGKEAFAGCTGLTSVTIPNSVTSIGDYAFFGCTGLTSVAIPNSVTSIGDYAFFGCTGLTSVTIPSSVTIIESYAFYGCSSLTSVAIPNSVTSIGAYAFSNCSSLTSLTIPSSVTSIGGYAFSICINLTSVTIPNSVRSIGKEAFAGCKRLTSIIIPEGVTIIESSAFAQCSSLTSVAIPNSVTSIGACAFSNCSSLTSVAIPNSVTSIGANAFSGCSSLTSVAIPKSVRVLNVATFSGCASLKDVYCYIESVPSTAADAFNDAPLNSATLHVPSHALSEYASIAPWKNFGEVVALSGGEDVPTVKQCATPSISYTKGKLSFDCSTNGASFVTTIVDSDVRTYNGNEIDLTVTYDISVYATASGYVNSEMATATLCWIDCNPTTEGIVNPVKKVEALPVLIQCKNGVLTIRSEGNMESTSVRVYNTSGQIKNSALLDGKVASIDTHMNSGEIAVVKIGEKSVKVMVK